MYYISYRYRYRYAHTHTHTHTHIYIYIYIYIYHHVALVARISLTLSRNSSLSFIAQGRSSGQHPVSSHSCWMYVNAGRPAFARPCVGVHKSTRLFGLEQAEWSTSGGLNSAWIVCQHWSGSPSPNYSYLIFLASLSSQLQMPTSNAYLKCLDIIPFPSLLFSIFSNFLS